MLVNDSEFNVTRFESFEEEASSKRKNEFNLIEHESKLH